ncbi:MAG: translation elongation factor Ts [bacterium]|nr:translation elongation factor Ts [Patescibacteria group bacterium]
MAITAGDIAKFRASTGAGMMDCKKALEEAGGDMEKAGEILRKKGIIKAAKRADKVAAEGLTHVEAKDDVAVIVEVNSETDFVAKNENFRKLINEVVNHLFVAQPKSVEEAMKQPMTGGAGTMEEYFTNATATIGEKISLRRFEVVKKNADEAFGAYVHMGGKISVLVVLTGSADESLAREVAMHVAAANPKYIRRDEVDVSVLKKEEEIYSAQLKAQGKPDNMIVNILKGKMEKFYSEVCALEQPFIKDEDKTVQKYLDTKDAGITIAKMYRYELGEGMEKKSCDFAGEVAEQLK